MTKPEPHFVDQGGVATMDPSPFRRWVVSKVMSIQANQKRMLHKRVKAERKRIKLNQPHVIEYFHQVDDGYSHLAVQVLNALVNRYDIKLRVYLVSAPMGLNVAEPKLLTNLGLSDAKRIAPHYGLTFPENARLPNETNKSLALAILAALVLSKNNVSETSKSMLAVSHALWENDQATLKRLACQFGVATPQSKQEVLNRGNARRSALKHYSSAMFYYAGEWYWGVDRLYHLEARLQSINNDRFPGEPCLLPRQEIQLPSIKDKGTLTLEVYVSIRSPYTAIAFDRAVQLAKDTGINFIIRPVLPMVMRGVPASKEKGLYILFDAGREARAAGVPYGNVCDPIGQPARHGYALYHWACKFDKGAELLSHFLRAAFAEGVNTNRHSGLRYVVEKTGLDWQEAKQHLSDNNWQQELEGNRLTMYQSGIWGVPSFRLLDQHRQEVLALWGQDRLWLIAREIERLLSA